MRKKLLTGSIPSSDPSQPDPIPNQNARILDFPDRARDPATFIEITPDHREKFGKNLTE